MNNRSNARRTPLGAKTEELIGERVKGDRALRVSDLDVLIAEHALKVNKQSGLVPGYGGASGSVLTINFNPAAVDSVWTVAFPGVTVGQLVTLSPSLDMPAGVAWDELEMDPIHAMGHVPANDFIRVVIYSLSRGVIAGARNFNLLVS